MSTARGKVTFKEDICKGCGLCNAACPVGILGLNPDSINIKGYHPAYVVEPDKCTGCTNCAVTCPDLVITVERR
ncbi:4Fe-4S dicluster domain-containing protein [Wansuia hejianensis]|uniref:4Fe-4S dicluster domain-containing protein n=1 Tax=Wansuia hejianensis TaxID=2763667 RepID=A0A926F190_9FIRM|nr:4Fe-4S dicluster domain-containing protein [Wansuia hejianensis]MBC8591516.1 4Fe-4S dicluster domain-containing protein [Wansuia hejianensis]